MRPEVYPIGITQIDWVTISKVFKEQQMKNPVSRLDDIGIDLKSPASFWLAMGEDYTALLHTHAIFLIVSAVEPVDILESGLIVKIKKPVYIVSGKLKDWYDHIMTYSVGDNYNYVTRSIVNQCQVVLEQAGFQKLFEDFFKQQDPDNDTFYLV